jgi:RND family efflux transporter MFP subunit
MRAPRILLTTTLASALLVSAVACGGPGEPSQPTRAEAPVDLATATAVLEGVALASEATGSVEPWVRVSPGTKILGRIDRVAVDVGQRVERGQLLASLEKRDLEAALDQARAAVVMSEARLENARSQYARMQTLHDRGSATAKNFEDATSGFHVAEAALQQARANRAAAEVMLDYAEIRSPTSGFVTAKNIEAGDMARPGEPLLVIEDLSRVKVVVTVPESEVVDLQAGDRARVTVEVLGMTRDAIVESVNPSGNLESRTFQVRLLLDEADPRLKSGMFARATFERGSREGLFVPARAVVERGALRGLFVLDVEDRGWLRWVRVGKTSGDRVEVLSGLRPGERYVVSPPIGLIDGTPVRES